MAPRRGGSSRSSTCPDAFTDVQTKVYFACTVVFLAIYLGITAAFCIVRRKTGAGKKLLGAPYIIAICFMIIGLVLELTATVLLECDTVDASAADSISIAMNVYYYLAYWVLLFVVVYTLSMMLREHLGNPSAIIKMTLLAIVGTMFAVTAAQIGMTSYNLWVARYNGDSSVVGLPAEHLRTAWNVLYLASILAAGCIAVLSIFTLRSNPTKPSERNLLPWVLTLILSMAIWSIIGVVFAASYSNDNINIITFETNAALTYVQAVFQALSFILLLCIARHRAWTAKGPDDLYNAQTTRGQYIHAG